MSSTASDFRLSIGGRINRANPVSFRFNGREITGYEGDTLASALLANGHRMVARSWKLHRPRGILSAGVEEPSALVQVGEGAHTVPNIRVTELPVTPGLVARSVHAWPSIHADWRVVQGWLGPLLPAGFYYKTFMASPTIWHWLEKHIRAASGLGAAPTLPDPDHYDTRFAHCDVLVVGAGIAGICAAQTAAVSGARVILVDEQQEPGGWLLSSGEAINGLPAAVWVAQSLAALRAAGHVTVLRRCSAFGYHDDNLITAAERLHEHLATEQRVGPRERLWKIRARQVILATGAHERPLVFANNDLPGVMLASAVASYVRRYAVLPGRRAIFFTNNDLAYEAALAMQQAGVSVQVIDARHEPDGGHLNRARAAGVQVTPGYVVTEATGWRWLRQVTVAALGKNGKLQGSPHTIDCDLLGVSGGFSPVIHLQSQSGARPVWDEDRLQFIAGKAVQAERSAGAAAGEQGLAACVTSGVTSAMAAVSDCGLTPQAVAWPVIEPVAPGRIGALWRVPHRRGINRAPKQFVDFQNDVTAADLALAVREGFESIEHVKRYTALGFGTDQGKTGNVNGLAIVASRLGRPIAEVGTTTFRPNYTPVSFGTIAGAQLGDYFEPVRRTALHDWHCRAGACFEDVGQWKRPYYYPRPNESMPDAVSREVLAARNAAGLMDASTLGKIDIQGPDALRLLEWVYCNRWQSLQVGHCRYGLMLDENGMILDDGVTARLAENHYLMHTTTGGAAHVLAWLEQWLQTEWPDLRVYLSSVTEHYATLTLTGAHARAILRAAGTDIDLDDAAFPFMTWREGRLAQFAVRVFRVSFTGERSYEINVAARQAEPLWTTLMQAGAGFDITPYGTEAMHVLRAEKGYIIVGQDTDGSQTPLDLGFAGMLNHGRDFIGRRALSRADTAREGRKQFVGLLAEDPQQILPEGGQVIEADAPPDPPIAMLGHVSSAYASPNLERTIALALIKAGRSRIGDRVQVQGSDGLRYSARICEPVFFDPTGERQHV